MLTLCDLWGVDVHITTSEADVDVQFLGAHLLSSSMYIVLELMKCDLYSALGNPDWSTILSWRER